MAIRDKLRERVAPLLEPGERIDAVFMAQTGASPYYVLLTWLTLFWTRYFVVVVTEGRIVVFRASRWYASKPKPGPVASEPRALGLGDPGGGLWMQVQIAGTRYWVHRRFRDDVRVATPTESTPVL